MKNMDKRSKIILLLLIFIPILIIFMLFLVKGCSSSNTSYDKYEKNMVNAAKKYVDNKNLFPVMEGGTVVISLSDLIDNGYIKSYKEYVDDNDCSGTVTVQNNGSSNEDVDTYLFIPDFRCSNYKTVHLIDKLKEDIVTEKSGLYETNDGYIYKGSKVNNYLSFFDKLYLILSIDNDNILKVLKIDSEKSKEIWDSKFNSQINKSYGKNDYSDSNIIEVLQRQYNNVSNNKKKHLVAYDVCVGNRNYDDVSISKDAECSQKLDNQFISLMNVYDYAMASYDSDCISIYSGACSNYNYIFNNIGTTWLMTGVNDNTYDVYYYSYRINYDKAKAKNPYNMVIYLNGNELYTKGDGSYSNPYVIGD